MEFCIFISQSIHSFDPTEHNIICYKCIKYEEYAEKELNQYNYFGKRLRNGPSQFKFNNFHNVR